MKTGVKNKVNGPATIKYLPQFERDRPHILRSFADKLADLLLFNRAAASMSLNINPTAPQITGKQTEMPPFWFHRNETFIRMEQYLSSVRIVQ
jgi:hypothetical protein